LLIMSSMARRSCVERLVSDELWEPVEPLLPKPRRARRGRTGRPRVPDRAALAGIVFVLKIGISWNALPQELGCGAGVTCWWRLREWQDAGVWQQLHRVVLDWLAQLDLLDWSRAAVDSVSVRAKRHGEATGAVRIARRGIEGSTRLGCSRLQAGQIFAGSGRIRFPAR
jgi:transposase